MDLLDRYLQAVRTYLPKAQQDDILKELRENLLAQIEDKEGELGRPLNEDEIAALLKKHGHPLFVASHYRQARHLIGPTLFPVYWFALKIILVFVGFGYAISALVLIAQGQTFLPILGAFFSYMGAMLPTFAWVTIVFAVLDIGNSKFRLLEQVNSECNKKFDPRALPPLTRASDSPDAKPISRAKTLFELFWSVAFLLWWVRVMPIQRLALFIALGPVGLADKIPFQLGLAWNAVFVPVILFTLVGITRQIVALIYPHRVKFHAVMHLIGNAGSVVILYLLSRSNEILVLSPGISDPAKLVDPLRIVNLTLHYVMIFTAVLTVFECLKQVRRLIRIGRNPAMSTAL